MSAWPESNFDMRRQAALAHGDGGDDDPLMNAIPREEHDAKIAASEARMETRFARIEGMFSTLTAHLSHVDTMLAEGRQDAKATQAQLVETRRHSTVVAIALVAAVVTALVGAFTIYQTGLTGRQVLDATSHQVQVTHPIPPAK